MSSYFPFKDPKPSLLAQPCLGSRCSFSPEALNDRARILSALQSAPNQANGRTCEHEPPVEIMSHGHLKAAQQILNRPRRADFPFLRRTTCYKAWVWETRNWRHLWVACIAKLSYNDGCAAAFISPSRCAASSAKLTSCHEGVARSSTVLCRRSHTIGDCVSRSLSL